VAGATPGLHFPESRFYTRRVRLSRSSELLPALQAAGYVIEAAVGDVNTSVVEIPVDVGESIRTLDTVSMWEQLALAAFLQAHWSDNQVLIKLLLSNTYLSMHDYV
jgi:ribonucleoside-triphosphate reductase